MRRLDELHLGAARVWKPSADGAPAAGRLGSQSEAGGPVAWDDGHTGAVPAPLVEPTRGGTSDVSLPIGRPGNHGYHVWCSDITYVPMAEGFLFLMATMDWWSRYVVGWGLSNTRDSKFCVRAWEGATAGGRRPLIVNTDQGSEFSSNAYIDAVESAGVDVSMDGRGRWLDNRFIERLWRSVKQEDIYLQDYGDGLSAQRGLARWFEDYNLNRPHQALEHATPAELYHSPESNGAKPARGDGGHNRGAAVVQPSGRPSEGLPSDWMTKSRKRLIEVNAERQNNNL